MNQKRERVKGGFLTDPGELSGGRVFVLNNEWERTFSDNLFRKDVMGIRIADASRQTDLNFLADLPPLKYIDVYVWGVKDLTPLESQRNVEHLGLECQFKKNFDFQIFPKLSELLAKWRPGMETALHNSTLKYLGTDGYPFTDVTPLAQLSQLRRLRLESRKLQSLKGIDALTELEDTAFVACPALIDISAIRKLSNLQKVMIYNCKKVTSLESFAGLEKLERLHFENGIEVQSIKPLIDNSSLRELFLIGMSVADGDLSPLLDLPRLERIAIAKKRHHSHTMQELNQALQNKQSKNTRLDRMERSMI